MRVLGISGSLRRGSHNTALLRHARGLFEAITPFTQKRKNWSARKPYVRPHRLGRIFGR